MQDLQAQRRGLRDELGEDKYDRYLFASGQPNRLTVMDVMDDSPAQRAGLRTGDMILRYGGERLWSRRDLRGVSFSGDGGEMMTLDIMRNGRTLQVFMPRGPLGVRLGMDSVNPNDGGGG